MTREHELHAAVQQSIDTGQLAGAIVLVHRNGHTEFAAAGCRDIENQLPMERDTIFRIASMTKPITSVAALMLVDEGRIALNDPITRVAPEFEHMRVLRSRDAALDNTEAAKRPITFGRPAHPSCRSHLCRLPLRPHRQGIQSSRVASSTRSA
jgi:CubicO group peptidase (beta-lactamase class C family)